VILWDDQNHSYAYVIAMLQQLFGYPLTEGYQLAHEVDQRGRAIVTTTTLERAEFKRDQIRAFGKDILMEDCPGSMYATIEPAP
jgi:ATP-dependent Clp protease adaptor protein ClpS